MESCVWTLWKLPRNFVTTLRWQVLIALVCRKRKKEKRRVLCEVSGADTGDSPACSWTGRPGCLAEETEMRVPGTATARRRGQNHHRHYISHHYHYDQGVWQQQQGHRATAWMDGGGAQQAGRHPLRARLHPHRHSVIRSQVRLLLLFVIIIIILL